MQPITGLHIASLIDQRHFDVRLHHEDWHGPFGVSNCGRTHLVFLTGLQPDFDRMRQLSFYFRNSGATVVAGGSICTSFPEFATRFFDVVCVGGVESAADVATAEFTTGCPLGRLRSSGSPPKNPITVARFKDMTILSFPPEVNRGSARS